MHQASPTTVRPPEGLARGLYEAPPWLIGAVAFLVAAFAVTLVVIWIRASRASRRR